MNSDQIRIFKSGKGTTTKLEFVDGKGRCTLVRHGAGAFLDQTFCSVQKARDFCEAKIETQPEDLFYVLEDELIVQTVLNHSYHQRKQRQFQIAYSCTTFLVFSASACAISLAVAPFQTTQANLLLAGAVSALCPLLLCVMGTKNLEGAVVLAWLLVILAVVLPALKKARTQHKGALPVTSFHYAARPVICPRGS